MIRGVGRWCILTAAAAAMLATLPGGGADATPDREPIEPRAHRAASAPLADHEGRLFLMHYMPWYTTPQVRGRWGGHWAGWENQHDPSETAPDGMPDIWSHYHPLIGLYDSTEPDVLECQLLQMKIAGIDGVIPDWYGITGAADYPEIHEATVALFEQSRRLGMYFAACYEDRTVEQSIKEGVVDRGEVPQHLAATFRWMHGAWFDAPHYVKIDGRPLVLNFGPIHVKDASAWDRGLSAVEPRPRLHALHHLWRDIGADGGFTWVHKGAWENARTPDAVARNLVREYEHTTRDPARMIVSATPGFHDVYARSFGRLPHRGGDTLRETLAACMSRDWPIVQLVTWNDYGEGTMFEPTHEFGYLFLEIIQEARRRELGDGFAFDKSHLRLPARLLELRREGEAPTATLDRIAMLLASGEPERAREAIERLER